MANQPPVGRWMRMATFRPIPNPTQDPPSPQPAAPRPVLGRAFTAVPFRPAVPTVPIPAGPMPTTATVTAPPRQATPAIRPASAQLTAGGNGIPPPQEANNTTAVTNGVRSPRQAPTAATVTNGVPSPQQAPTQLSQLQAPIAVMPNVKPSPLPSTAVNVAPSPPKSEVAPYASPVQQTINAEKGAQQLLSPQTKSPPPTSTNITSPKSPFTTQSYTPKSPSQQSPPQALASYRSPMVSPLPQKQPASPPNFTSTISAPAPRTVTFSNIESFTSPTKSQLSTADSAPQIRSPNTSNPPDRTPPQSPKTMSLAPPPSPLNRSIITIAGENRGALMNLGSPRPRITPSHRKFPGNPHKLTSPNSSESDESSGRNNINNYGKSKSRDLVSSAMKSFMNSNVQGINNSLMFNSTVTHHDPGVHLALSRKPKGHDHGNESGVDPALKGAF